MGLTLRWRTLAEDAPSTSGYVRNYSVYNGAPKWLDRSKLAALGFDTSRRKPAEDFGGDRISSREVYLCLEFDGPAYAAALERARRNAASAEAAATGNAGTGEFGQRAKFANELLVQEKDENSRLFVVDAGLDVAALRARYPDRTRYAIVRGQVRPHWVGPSSERAELVGYVVGTNADHVNVPLEFHSLLPRNGWGVEPATRAALLHREITLDFGRRLEPWIASVTMP